MTDFNVTCASYIGTQQVDQERQHIGQLYNLPRPASSQGGLATIVAQEDQVLTQLITGTVVAAADKLLVTCQTAEKPGLHNCSKSPFYTTLDSAPPH